MVMSLFLKLGRYFMLFRGDVGDVVLNCPDIYMYKIAEIKKEKNRNNISKYQK